MLPNVHRWSARGTTIVALCLAVAGCVRKPEPATDSAASAPPSASPGVVADSSAGIELRTDRGSYRAGDKATLTIVNHTGMGWTFNPCTHTLERATGGTWQVVPEGRMCTMEAWILKPNETRTAQTSFGSSLEAGRYRLVIAFAAEGAPARQSTTATSAPVSITK